MIRFHKVIFDVITRELLNTRSIPYPSPLKAGTIRPHTLLAPTLSENYRHLSCHFCMRINIFNFNVPVKNFTNYEQTLHIALLLVQRRKLEVQPVGASPSREWENSHLKRWQLSFCSNGDDEAHFVFVISILSAFYLHSGKPHKEISRHCRGRQQGRGKRGRTRSGSPTTPSPRPPSWSA